MTRPRRTEKDPSDALMTIQDPFAQLPTEILQMILKYNKDSELPTAPISRSLLPFQRLHHFETCLVTSVGAFLRLQCLLQDDGALPNSVKIFEFRAADSLPSIPLIKLAHFLTTLSNLERLTLFDFSPDMIPIYPQSNLARCLLESRIELPNLKHLAFRIPSHWSTIPLNPQLYLFLDRFPSLVSLEIVLDNPVIRGPIATSGLPLAFSRITSLIVRGGNGITSDALAKFASLFPNLITFEARSPWHYDDSNLTKLASLLPVTLQSLAFEPWSTVNTFIAIDTSLSRYRDLETLILCHGTFSTGILSHLRQLPRLKTLTFENQAYPPLNDLRTRNALPPSLKKIVMNQIKSGKIGLRIEDPFAPLPPTAPLGKLGPGWVLPDFNFVKRFFTLDSLRETVETLRGFGIVVEGSAVEAMKVHEEGLIESKHVETAFAIECGNFVGLKEKYAEEWTKTAKAERRRRKKAQDLIKKERAEARKIGKGKKGGGGGGTKKKGGGKKSK